MNTYEFAENTTNHTILAVPDYSQLDTSFGFEVDQMKHMCGVVSVKAVSDYYAEKLNLPALEIDTIVAAYKNGGNIQGAIKNAAQVDMLKAQGLITWRRNWNNGTRDPQWLVDHEDYDASQFEAVDQQQRDEARFDDKRWQAHYDIIKSLEEGNPIIVSVEKGFYRNEGDHHVVLTGIDDVDTAHPRFIVMDPYRDATESGYFTVDFDRFFDYFNYRAIFAKPAN